MHRMCAVGLVLAVTMGLAQTATAQVPPPPRQKTGETLIELYLSPQHHRFEIDYDQQHHAGSGVVMKAIGVYLISYSDGSFDFDVRNVSSHVLWASSNEDVYPILGGELGNLDEDGLLITWQYNEGVTGVTIITITHPVGLIATGSITAYDSRK